MMTPHQRKLMRDAKEALAAWFSQCPDRSKVGVLATRTNDLLHKIEDELDQDGKR